VFDVGYITPTSTRIPLNMPVSLVHFTAFFQGEDIVERGENRDLWTENNVLCGDVTYATCSLSRYVYSTTASQRIIQYTVKLSFTCIDAFSA